MQSERDRRLAVGTRGRRAGRLSATLTSSATERTPSFFIRFPRWNLIVFSPGAKLGSDLLVEPPRGDLRHDLALAGGEQLARALSMRARAARS